MTLEDTLEIKRRIVIDKTITELKTFQDISAFTDSSEKLSIVVKTFVEFMPQMGFEASETLDALVELITPVLEHPDNTNYEKESAVEEHINNDDNLEGFLEALDKSRDEGDTKFVLEVYRAWVTYKLHEKEDNEKTQ